MSDVVWLGGETHARSIIRVKRIERIDWIIFCMFAAVAFIVLSLGRSVLSLLAAGAVVGAGALICFPVDFGLAEGMSLLAALRTHVGRRYRARSGLDSNETGGIPSCLGSVNMEDVPSPYGVFGVFEHAAASDKRGFAYYTIVLEAQGMGESGAWEALLAHASSDAQPFTHLIQTSRISPWDSTDHSAWITQALQQTVIIPELVDSYAQVVDDLAENASAMRTWITARIPLEALAVGEDGVFAAVAQAGVSLLERASSLGIAMRPLSTRARAALIRHLLDPSISPDDYAGLGGGLEGAFAAYVPREDGRALLVEASSGALWHSSTWELAPHAFIPAWLPVDFLYPLTVGLPGALTRTITVACELESIRKARRRAREDVTRDMAALAKSAAISSGEEESQASASTIRLDDLAPGSGAGGVRWSMAISFHTSEDKWEADCRTMRAALEDCSIPSPSLLRHRQDEAAVWMWALGAAWKEGK